MDNRLAILTTFCGWDDSYSLCQVVRAQIEGLQAIGVDPVLLACPGWEPPAAFPKVETRFLPRYQLHDYWPGVPLADDFEAQVEEVAEAAADALSDCAHVFTHGILRQGWHLQYNGGLRHLARARPDLRWHHWVHSRPIARPADVERPYSWLFSLPPNSRVVYPNDDPRELMALAQMYGCSVNDIDVVPHPTSFRAAFGLDEETWRVLVRWEAFDREPLLLYPTALHGTKGLEDILLLLAGLKKHHANPLAIIAAANAGGEPFASNLRRLKGLAKGQQLEQNVVWTCDESPLWQHAVPYDQVMALFRLADVFVLPSEAETFSLIAQEAALSRNLLVLNQDFPPMQGIFGGADPIWAQFGSDLFTTEYNPNKQAYLRDIAGRILAHLRESRQSRLFARLRRERNPVAIAGRLLRLAPETLPAEKETVLL
jgi:glycosyltransferase involved in cell wall biosynthesis